jgi:hypothetical protein
MTHRYVLITLIAITPAILPSNQQNKKTEPSNDPVLQELFDLEKTGYPSTISHDTTPEKLMQLFLTQCLKKNPTQKTLCVKLATAYKLIKMTYPNAPMIDATFDGFATTLAGNEKLIESLSQALICAAQAEQQAQAAPVKRGPKKDSEIYREGPTCKEILDFVKNNHDNQEKLHFLDKLIAQQAQEGERLERERRYNHKHE